MNKTTNRDFQERPTSMYTEKSSSDLEGQASLNTKTSTTLRFSSTFVYNQKQTVDSANSKEMSSLLPVPQLAA